ncbi:K(+) efflux antiporter 4 [Orobanche gracilis]
MRTFVAFVFVFVILSLINAGSSMPENGVSNGTASNNTTNPKEDSFADMIDHALEKEFNETDELSDVTDHGSFNNSVTEQQAVLETVARFKPKKNETKDEKAFEFHDVFNLDNENRPEDTPTLIDKKDNVFIMSNPKSKFPILQLDLRFISDLVIVIVFATCGGVAFACAGQPVITGYLLAGSVIGPGGFSFVSEMVQVETVAQFGVIFLLFALGLEFSAVKIRVVRAVAVFGGLLQIFLFMCLCGITALLCGGEAAEGVFVGVFLSMSSTAVVLKFLMERSSINTLHGQVTVGTLILQDCAVGLLFALLPILGGTSGALQGVVSMTKLLVVLATFLAILSILSRTCIPRFLKLMISLSSQTNELYQLASVAFCLLVAWCSDKLGLSLELGSFAAGVMISTTDLAQHTLEQILMVLLFHIHIGDAWSESNMEVFIFVVLFGKDVFLNQLFPTMDFNSFLQLSSIQISHQIPISFLDHLFPRPTVLGKCSPWIFMITSDLKGSKIILEIGFLILHHDFTAVEPIRNLFAALFLASIGMLIHVQFLWNHIDILVAAVILVIVIKTVVVTLVVRGFRYNNKTSLLVGMSLAQIGEFAFVLLSRASNLKLIEGKLYMLLLGTTALSLVTTPLLFKVIPAVVHLGVLLRWFSPELTPEIGLRGDIMLAESAKHISLMVRGPRDS